MNLIADTHCHTIASTHAYSTVNENAAAAKAKGLCAVAVTNHGIAMPDAPHIWHFENLDTIPHVLDGVAILYGVEANIIDFSGHLDMEDSLLKSLDWVVASFHTPVCRPSTIEDHTNAYIGVAKNPYVDVIGHSGQSKYSYDYEKVIKVFKEYDKIVELNEGSHRIRKDSLKNCMEIAKLCKKYGVKVVVNSDAHHASAIGVFPKTLQMLKEIDFPEELVLNANADRLFGYIQDKRGIDFNQLRNNR